MILIKIDVVVATQEARQEDDFPSHSFKSDKKTI